VRLLVCAAALAGLLACGHYGPPRRPDPDDSTAVTEPAQQEAECEEDEEKKAATPGSEP
jgi:predicted small lipoprotein YifL